MPVSTSQKCDFLGLQVCNTTPNFYAMPGLKHSSLAF